MINAVKAELGISLIPCFAVHEGAAVVRLTPAVVARVEAFLVIPPTRWRSSAAARTGSGTSETTGCGSEHSADRSHPSVSFTSKRGLSPAFGEEPRPR